MQEVESVVTFPYKFTINCLFGGDASVPLKESPKFTDQE